MSELVVLCEDAGHWLFVEPFVTRISSEECGSPLDIRVDSKNGGRSAVIRELRAIGKSGTLRPGDTLVVCMDADTHGVNTIRDEILREAQPLVVSGVEVVPVIPDPEIEKWMLVDDGAFASVFGAGCRLHGSGNTGEDFKKVLQKELLEQDIDAPLGGMESAPEIIAAMNLQLVASREPSFNRALSALRTAIRRLCADG